jgi:hypothetical protein
MSRNPSHQKKTPYHLREYTRAINRQQYEPTIDETLPFNNTTNPGEDLSGPLPQKRRPINRKAQIEDYIKENWIPWAFTIFVLIAGYFVIDSKIDLARVFENLHFHSAQMDGLKNDVKEISKDKAKQDLEIQQHKMRLEQLERKK